MLKAETKGLTVQVLTLMPSLVVVLVIHLEVGFKMEDINSLALAKALVPQVILGGSQMDKDSMDKGRAIRVAAVVTLAVVPKLEAITLKIKAMVATLQDHRVEGVTEEVAEDLVVLVARTVILAVVQMDLVVLDINCKSHTYTNFRQIFPCFVFSFKMALQ